jgi:hypothetical protein
MFNLVCNYDSAQHFIIEPEIIRWCRRQVDDKEIQKHLFAYYHLKEDTYVIGWWINSEYGPFVDLLNLGHNLNNFDRARAQEFTRRLRQPTTASDIKNFSEQAETNDLHNLQEQSSAEAERIDRKLNYGME